MNFKEYQLEIIDLYDKWKQKEEKRGVSYGEIAYIESLKKRELEEIEKELINEEIKEKKESIPLF